MERISGDEKSGRYEAVLSEQPEGTLVRYRIITSDATGAQRIQPAEYEPRPTYSYYCFDGTNTARVALGFLIQTGPAEQPGPSFRRRPPSRARASGTPVRGNGAFVYVPAGSAQAEVFDHVTLKPRSGGFKVHFHRDRTLKGMTGINLVHEGKHRWTLAEPLAYEVYRMAGVPAELTEHVRLTHGGRALGHYLLVEQPNRAFLARNKRDNSGNLYKVLWYGDGVVGSHEKKTNPAGGHDDIVALVEGLNEKTGDEQWKFIQTNFNVEEVASYFAVNMCIQNWDGFFNNHYVYHDLHGSGKWEIYPWDEDKTWGDYDGASPQYDWYELPLTYGMNGDKSPRSLFGLRERGPFGGVGWWRPPGYLSGPLLANPGFRKQFLLRLREICSSTFTEEKLFPVMRELELRLRPEVRFRAELEGEDPQAAQKQFLADMESFRSQVKKRRQFLLSELEKAL
jgi:hypothetical protein